MRKDTLYITLSRDITSYTITSGQRAIATNVNYAVTIESPMLTTNLAGRDVSLIISDTDGNTLTTATTFYPDTKNPYKAVTGSLLLDGGVYGKFFDGKPVDTAVRLPIVIRDKSATLLSSDIVVANGSEVAEPSASDEIVAGLVNAIRFYDLAEFKAWLDGTKERPDGLKPTDIVVGQWVHTQQDGSFICKELIGAEPSVTKNFTTIVTQFPLTGTLKMNPDNGVGLSVYSGDVYNDDEATSFSVDAITYKGDAFTFTVGDNQVARQKDNYALENRVNSTMKSTLDAIKADNDETYAAMLPVRNETVEARDRAEAAARGAKASETRAITAEENAATSEQNADASKKSAAVSEANAGLYRQQALAYSQKAETEAATATTKATEASTSASEASASAGDALAHKNDAGGYAEAARLSAEASAVSADSSATSAAASRSSADTAAQSESIAVSSAAAAASSANTASEHKDAALSSATNAATSATNAATSATNAATSSTSASNFSSAASDSAKAAATSAADLAEAVATAEGLDNRITLLENGKGVYKDPATGKVSLYTPLPQCPDGTLKVVSNIGVACKVVPVELADNERCSVSDNGNYVFIFTGPGHWDRNRVWIYDWTLKRRLYIDNRLGSGKTNGENYNGDITRGFEVFGDYFYALMGGDARIGRWRLGSPEGPAEKIVALENRACGLYYNQASGHICVAYIVGTYPNFTHYLLVFDADLNPVLDENGEQVVIDISDTVRSYAQYTGYLWLSHRHVYGRTYVFQITNVYGSIEKNMALMVANADDTLSVVRESVPVEDPDNPGKVLLEKDAEGNLIIDDESLSWRPRPVTTEGRELRINVDLEASRGYAKFAHRGTPRFQKHRISLNMPSTGYFMSDGIDTYQILKDGRFVSYYRCNGVGWPNGRPANDYKPNLRPERTGVTDCIVGERANQDIPLFSVGCSPSTWSATADIGLLAYAPWMPTSTLTQNVCFYELESTMRQGTERYVPITFSFLCGNNASPLGATWGFFGSPCWFATYDSMINGGIM